MRQPVRCCIRVLMSLRLAQVAETYLSLVAMNEDGLIFRVDDDFQGFGDDVVWDIYKGFLTADVINH